MTQTLALDHRSRLALCHQCRGAPGIPGRPAGCWRVTAPSAPRARLHAAAIAAQSGYCPLGKWGVPPARSGQAPATLVQPQRGPVDVVYFLGPGSTHDDWELRYSLRSVAKNFLDLGLVIVVGHKPAWLTGVVHLDVPDRHRHNKDANLIDKLLAAIRWGASDWFLNVSDDQVLLKPVHFGDCRAFHLGDLARRPADFWGADRWKDRLKRTMQHLAGRGLPAGHHDCHVPFPIHGPTFAEVAASCDYATPPGYTIHTLYGNSAPIAREPIGKRKVTYERACNSSFNIARNLDAPDAIFLGYSDAGLTPHLQTEIENRFPLPSRFEADRRPIRYHDGSPDWLHLPDIETVVYTTDKPHCRARHPRVKTMLDGAGFRNWSFFWGKPGRPYWQMIRAEYAALLREHEPPILILEDDIAPYDFRAWIHVPAEAEVVYLGGGGAWRGGAMVREARRHCPDVDIRRVKNIGLADIDADWVRTFGMFSTHAILYRDKRVMLEMADAIERDPLQVDVIFGKNQWRWQCVLRRRPMWYQQDGHNDRGTIDYCGG